MVGSAVSSASKKKKEAAKRAGQQPPAKNVKTKSIGELLEELANPLEEPYRVEMEYPAEPEADCFEEEYATPEEIRSAAERLEAIAYRPVERVSATRMVEEQLIETADAEPTDINEIIRDFDLRRAVIEAEILKPKFEQY